MGFADIDLSKLPAPKLVEELDAEKIFDRLKADLSARFPSLTPRLELESDPMVKELQTVAYEGMLVRHRINDAAQAVLLSHATGADLDALAALVPLERKILIEQDLTTDPVTEEVKESDKEFRRRIRLAPLAFSTGGSRGAWIYHALNAHPDVMDADSVSPAPNQITVAVLSRIGDGTPSDELKAAVEQALNDDEVRPQGDIVTVQAAQKLTYSIGYELDILDGPDQELVRQAAENAVRAYVQEQTRIGGNILVKKIESLLFQEGVENFTQTEALTDQIGAPDPNVPADLGKVPFAESISITIKS